MATFPVMIYTLFSSWRVSYIARNNSAVVLGREFVKQNLFEFHHSTNVSDPASSKWTHSSLPPGFLSPEEFLFVIIRWGWINTRLGR